MRQINKWTMGVNMSWATWGLETAVRPHVASLLLNAKKLESEWRFQHSGSGEDKFGDILLIQPNSCMLYTLTICYMYSKITKIWTESYIKFSRSKKIYLLSTEYFTRTFCIHFPDIMYNEFIIYFLKNRSF